MILQFESDAQSETFASALSRGINSNLHGSNFHKGGDFGRKLPGALKQDLTDFLLRKMKEGNSGATVGVTCSGCKLHFSWQIACQGGVIPGVYWPNGIRVRRAAPVAAFAVGQSLGEEWKGPLVQHSSPAWMSAARVGSEGNSARIECGEFH